MMHRTMAMVGVLLAAMMVGAGCGSSGKSVDDVESCLKGLGMTVERADKADASMREGVFATTPLAAGGATKQKGFTFAMAGFVKSPDKVKTFEDASKAFAQRMGDEGKLDTKSGTDGNYVWVVGGRKGSDLIGKAQDCVEP